MKTSPLALALSFALSLGLAAPAWAQNAPAAPEAPAAQHTPPVPAQTSGNLARFVVGPGGRVRALVLDNGAVVMVPPRASDDLAQRVRVGQAVRAEGLSRPGAGSQVIFRATVRNASGQVIAEPPALPQGAAPGALHGRMHGRMMGRMHGGMMGHGGFAQARAARLAAMPSQAVNGTVQQVLSGPRGGVRALLLANNATVYVPRPMMAQLRQRGVRVGESVRASGHGTATAQGTGLVADQLAFGDGTTLTAAPPAAR